MIVFDTSVAYALLDAADARHAEAVRWYESYTGPIATTPLVLCELDHLARARAGEPALRAFRADVAGGAYPVEWWAGAPEECAALAERYAGLGVSLADSSLVALAARLGTATVATFDERHFRAMTPLGRPEAFRLIPADA